MTSAVYYRHREDFLPGAVVSACAYDSSGQPEGDHRGLPSPWITFIVSVDGPVRVSGTVEDGDRFDPRRATSYDVVVAGLHPVAARVEQPAAQSGVQIAVHPFAAPALLGCRASELRGPGDHGHEVLGRVASELHDRVCSSADGESRLDVMQEWVRSRADQARPASVRSELARAWQVVAESSGRCRIDDLAREVALSPRQLRALMVSEIGVSPKQLCRAFRFDSVIARLADGSGNLAEVAAASGYADQAHLTREFGQMAGCSPTQWLAEERRNIQDGGHRNRPD
ncbi:MAG: Transcriptional regulator, AraC family [Marmoricola sp.]|nr:Transcriptional regulator, AraC family [Marmoricola sp.]